MPEPEQPSTVTPTSQLDQIANDVKDLKARAAEAKLKDKWDKAGVVAQFISGGLIAALGITVTLLVGRGQEAASERLQVSNYLKELVSRSTDPLATANLLSVLDISVSAQDSVPIAMHYAGPGQDSQVRQAAISVLRRVKKPGVKRLQLVKAEGSIPESDIASGLLGDDVKVRVRVSDIDDEATLVLNGDVLKSLTFAQDSDWMEIGSKMKPGKNNLILCVKNGPYGGFGGRLRISAGSQQYDAAIAKINECPCNAPAFDIKAHFLVNGAVTNESTVLLKVDDPDFYPAVQGDGKAAACANVPPSELKPSP